MAALVENGDISGSDVELYTMPETVLCVDTICHICYAEFLQEDDLKIHIAQQHITEHSKSRYCQFCSSIFASLEEYALHIIEVHIFSLQCCKYCMRAFTLAQDLKAHEKKHIRSNAKNPTQLYCSECNSKFKNVSSLQLHEYCKHFDSKDGVILRDCYSLLSSLLNIKAQTFLASLRTSQKHICGICNLTTSDVNYYIQHLQQKNCRSLACDTCCNVYRDLASLVRHFETNMYCQNHINEDFQMKCTKCDKMFNYNEVQEHTKVCQAVKCQSCDVIFETMEKRKEHQVKSHPLIFCIIKCKYCQHDFVGQEALDKHIKRVHEKDMHLYKYFCIYCKNIYNHPKKLFNHFFFKHRDLEPFTCKICDKTFKLRKRFTLHIKIDHSSVGSVKFDENYHVIFEQSVAASTEDVDNDQDKSIKNEIDKDKDSSGQLSEPAKETNMLQRDKEVDSVLYQTENEKDQPDKDKKKKMIKRRRKIKNKNIVDCVDLTLEDGTEDSDDEPLIKKRRRAKTRQENTFPNWLEKTRSIRMNKFKFTCKFCKKYCYTYQNYHHHMSLHQYNNNKKCIKCPKTFRSNNKLKQHISKEHSTSKLTETLKNVLERRKNTNNTTEEKPVENNRLSTRNKFLKTIKKVNIDGSDTAAKVTLTVNKLSAKKFIENFMPESNGVNSKGNSICVNDSLTIKPIVTSKERALIKLTKSIPTQAVFTKLKKPERFKDDSKEKYNVSIKIADPGAKSKMNFDQPIQEAIAYEDNIDDNAIDQVIPEVAEEIMLDETEEFQPKDVFREVVLPNLSDYKDVHIAHLLPEAPYYKIVKIDEVLNEKSDKEHAEKKVHLPDGTKLVNVNPLAHLLEGKQIDLQTNRYYKPKLVNFEKAVADALFKSKKTQKTKKSRKKIVNEQ